MRSFTSPSGRRWVAQVVEPAAPSRITAVDEAARGPAPSSGAVLRFQSDSLVLELREWPVDWATLPDEALVALVRQAQPPSLGIAGDTGRARAGER